MIKREDFISDEVIRALDEITVKLKEIIELKKIAFGKK